MKFIFPIFAALLLMPSQAWAWGKTGHRVIGTIAQQHLETDAQAAILGILGVEDLAEASTWPDFMRASQDEFWRREAGPYHYVTIPEGKTYAQAGAPERGDAITALKKFRAILKDPQSSREEKQLALRFIIHIIGDLHQPLHAGNGNDRGGNDFKLTFFGKLTNLHRIWDASLIGQEELSYSELANWLSRRITPALALSWAETDPAVWAEESAAIRETIYPKQDADVKWDYVFEHRGTMRTRLSQSGIRLAAYLNETFAQ
ncbi:MAG: S1/P1 Nuclease [Robiginitomaculum sp.]|nr:MAG: S1/P1 Nuclease [Robiginitomaculum sp.]